MGASAIEKTAQALDLIPYILEHPGVSIEELADSFESTPPDISEILSIIFMCGLPGYTHLELIDLSTEHGFVSIMDPQNLDKPRRLTKVEVVSILLGLQNLVSQGVSAEVAKIVDSVSKKMTDLLGDIATLEIIEGEQKIPRSEWKDLVEIAITDGKALDIEYLSLSNEKISIRTISPKKLYIRASNYYVEAYCDSSKEIRHFRLDRMRTVSISPRSISTSDSTNTSRSAVIEALIPKSALYFLETNEEIVMNSEIFADQLRVSLEVTNEQWLFRALASINGSVTITSPESLKAKFADLSRRTLDNYA